VNLPSGQELAVRITPATGPAAAPAVMIHGLGGSALNWTDLAGDLSGELESHAVDLPGWGFSPPALSGEYTMVAYMSVVADYLQATFPGQAAHVFGNSMGGAIALQLAAHRPELVASLCLVAPALPELRPRATNVHLPVMTLPKVGDYLFDKYQNVGPRRRVQATFDLCFADPSRIPPGRLAEAEEEARRRDGLPYARDVWLESIRGLLATYVDRGPGRPWKLAEQVSAPTMLVYGRADKLVNPIAAHRATRAFPKADVVVIPDSGHVAQMEHPGLVAGMWRTFLGTEHD
jgi:pimeloyl-ACP methyl ester carboxylesterase